MENLTDDELKKESKTESKNDMLSGIINALKCLASRVPKQEEKIKNLELFRLKIILRLWWSLCLLHATGSKEKNNIYNCMKYLHFRECATYGDFDSFYSLSWCLRCRALGCLAACCLPVCEISASPFGKPSQTEYSTFLSTHLWHLGFLSCWCDDLELTSY